jgi:hypothetical protein
MGTTYNFVVEGTAANGQTWIVSGVITRSRSGEFKEALDAVQDHVFMELTRGKAIYGKPGIGCRGPYTITALEIALEGSGEDVIAA